MYTKRSHFLTCSFPTAKMVTHVIYQILDGSRNLANPEEKRQPAINKAAESDSFGTRILKQKMRYLYLQYSNLLQTEN